MSQHKQSLRKTFRSACANKNLADRILDSIVLSETQLNAMLVKLNADNPASLDIDYSSTLAITDLFMPDVEYGFQNKASLRKAFISAMANKKLANTIIDFISSYEASINALLVKLDAQGGTLTDTNFVSLLGVSDIDFDAEVVGAQNKASLRKVLISSCAHKNLAESIISAISSMITSYNAVLAKLDAGTITGVCSALQVSVLDPEGLGL